MNSMKKSLFIFTSLSFLLSLLLLSCNSKEELITEPEPEQEAEPVLLDTINYLALGDSYTIGQGVEDSLRWPIQLSEKLIADGFEVNEPTIIAQTGWRTSDLINAISNSELEEYNLVSLLIGVNNQYVGGSFQTFTTEFDSLLNTSIELAGGKERVFVLSIPDYGVTPFGSSNSVAIATEIDMYNNYMNEKCSQKEIPFIDITEISRNLGDSPGALAGDNLHPSGSQYAEWTEEAFPIVKSLLEE